MDKPSIDVVVSAANGGDSHAEVTVRASDGSATTHRVKVPTETLARLAPGRPVAELVRASFEFLLEREPKESILRTFDIEVIGQYFPEYEIEIARSLR